MEVKKVLNAFPEPYRSQAIHNYNVQLHPVDEEIQTDYISDVLKGAFDWDDTPEGFNYWSLYYETLVKLNV